MGTPQSVIHICANLRIDSGYIHSIYFASPEAQQGFFAGKVVKTLSAYSYLRKTWPLKVDATMEEAQGWTYLYFRNMANGKYYYYFIDTVEYVNDNTVELGLQLDVIQTYMFDYWLDHSFVERMHTPTDRVGEHTVDEGLDLGECVINDMALLQEYQNCCILVLSTVYLNGVSAETTINTYSRLYNNTFSGLYISAIAYEDWAAWGTQLDNLSKWGKLDGVIGMWMYPQNLVTLVGGNGAWVDGTIAKTVSHVAPINHAIPSNVGKAGGLNGYTPRNNKLWCYPFNFLYLSNNNGGSAIYHYEKFKDGPAFVGQGALSPDAGVRLVPLNYKGATVNYDEALTAPPFPTCAWDADIYKMWLAQNQATHDYTRLQSAVQAGAGIAAVVAGGFTLNATAALGGALTTLNAANQIGSLMAAKKDMEVQPPQARGNFSASINRANATATFAWHNKSITAEYAMIIDRYFDMYGYRVNRYEVPNIAARPAYTYIKTVGCNIHGNLCNDDLSKIRSIYDHGITFWKDGNEVGNYSLNNSV